MRGWAAVSAAEVIELDADQDELIREIDARVNSITSALRDLEELAEAATTPDVPLSLLYQLAEVKRQINGVRGTDDKGVFGRVEAAALTLMGEKQVKVEPFGTFESRKKTKRNAWRWDELVPVVVARALDERKLDEETGEYEREAEAVARVMRECVGFSSGKVRGLEARGLDPAEFCTEEPDGWQIQLPAQVKDDES